jgi:hypothetical protein
MHIFEVKIAPNELSSTREFFIVFGSVAGVMLMSAAIMLPALLMSAAPAELILETMSLFQ